MASTLNVSKIEPLTGSGTLNIGSSSSNTIQIDTTNQRVTAPGELRTNTIQGIGANTVNFTAPMTVGGATLAGRRNLIINGAMTVAQRGTSFTGFGAGVNYSLDRFANFHNSDGAFTVSQETSVVPDDFTHALKIQTTTADASIAAGQRLIVFTRCEGNVVSHLNWGTSAAKTVTLSFYVRSSITGIHGGAIANGSDNRNYPFTYTISSADTWERKTITIPGDQTGTWATGTGRSLQVVWGLGVGSTYSGTAGAWASGDVNSATGATTGVLGTLNATFYITGIQLEVGTVATPFEHASYGDELARCLRYTYVPRNDSVSASDGSTIATGYCQTGSVGVYFTEFPVPMRDIPTLTTTSTAGSIEQAYHNAGATSHNVTDMSYVASISGNQKACFTVGSASFSGGESSHLRYSTGNIADNIIVFSAEL